MGGAHHSSISFAEFEILWSHASTPPYVFIVWSSVESTDSFSLYLLQYVIFISLGILLFTDVQFLMHEIIIHFNFSDNFAILT